MSGTVFYLLEYILLGLLIQRCQCRIIIKEVYATLKPTTTTTDCYPYKFIQQPMYKIFEPRGFRIWFEDNHIVRFYLYANMNEPFNDTHPESTEPQMFAILKSSSGVFWIYKTRFVEFGPNDTLYYFIKVVAKDGSYSVSKVYTISKFKQ